MSNRTRDFSFFVFLNSWHKRTLFFPKRVPQACYCSTFFFLFWNVSSFFRKEFYWWLFTEKSLRVHFGSTVRLLRGGQTDIGADGRWTGGPCVTCDACRSVKMVTCQRLPGPCWPRGSCTAASAQLWGSHVWRSARSPRRYRSRSSWSAWSSAWRRWWIAGMETQ